MLTWEEVDLKHPLFVLHTPFLKAHKKSNMILNLWSHIKIAKEVIMLKSKVWPAALFNMKFKLHLVIHEIEKLLVEKFQDSQNSSLLVQIEWRGTRKNSGFLPKGFQRNCTSKQGIQSNGVVCWNEEFDHVCKLKRTDSKRYRSWIIKLVLQKCNQDLEGKTPILGKAKVDIAELVHPINETSIRLPINCNIRGHAFEAVLKATLSFTELQTSSSSSFKLSRAFSLRSFSCTRFPQTLETINGEVTILPRADSLSDDDPGFNYGKQAMTNFFLLSQHTTTVENNTEFKETHLEQSTDKENKQQSFLRLLSLNKKEVRFRAVNHSKFTALLNQASREEDGDDIVNEGRHQSSVQSPSQERKVVHEDSRASGFEDGVLEVGNWEKKVIISRDRKMELVADVFLASIDQRSEKAAGGNACTVLAAVVADWLHKNPNALPIRCQFDELIREGSSEWRQLCTNENHKEKFSDQHFDLDTVLEANIRPLSVITDMSYIGFFSLENVPENFELLQGAMSFDGVWKEILCIDKSEEQIYIVSWNDHFFVIKVENDVVYLIDTLGERLSEGCSQAYILKFDRDSTIYKWNREPGSQTEEPKECTKPLPESGVVDVDQNSSRQVFSEGMDSCREYIKGFLAAIPLRELQHDIEKGLMEKAPLHQRLQIEFHFTVPHNIRS